MLFVEALRKTLLAQMVLEAHRTSGITQDSGPFAMYKEQFKRFSQTRP